MNELAIVQGTAPLDDAVLAEYITHLHQSGKSPSTIAQVVAAVKWTGSSGRTLTGCAPSPKRAKRFRACVILR